MVNTDFAQDDHFDNFDKLDDEAPYRTFGLGLSARPRARVSMRREHR